MGIKDKGLDITGMNNRIPMDKFGALEAYDSLKICDAQFINMDRYLANSGLSEFSGLGYDSMANQINKNKEDFEVLCRIPEIVIREMCEMDAQFKKSVAKAVDEIENVSIDEIHFIKKGIDFDALPSVPQSAVNRFSQLVNESHEDNRLELVQLLCAQQNELTDIELRRRDVLIERVMRNNVHMAYPFSKEEVLVFLKDKEQADISFFLDLMYGVNSDEIDMRYVSDEVKYEGITLYCRHLLPQEFANAKNIDTTEFTKFNNGFLGKWGFELSSLDEACKKYVEHADLNCMKTYATSKYEYYNNDYYAYKRLWQIFNGENQYISKGIPSAAKVEKIVLDAGKPLDISIGFGYNSFPQHITDEQLTYSHEEFDEYLKSVGFTREQYYSAIFDEFMYLDMYDNDYSEGDAEKRKMVFEGEDIGYRMAEKITGGRLTYGDMLALLGQYSRYTGESSYNGKAPRETEYRIVFDAVRRCPELAEMELVYVSRTETDENDDFIYNPGTNGIAFRDPQSNDWYVAYRGTSNTEWIDDGLRACVEKADREHYTLQMNQALDFFDSVVDRANKPLEGYSLGKLYVTGHSQGGNDAQIAMLLSRNYDRITEVYSFDGEGHSPEMLADLISQIGMEEYNRRVSKMYSICGQEDFVNPLAQSVFMEDHVKYVDIKFTAFDVGRRHDEVSMFAQKAGLRELDYSGMINSAIKENGEYYEQNGIMPHVTDELWELMSTKRTPMRRGCAVVALEWFQDKMYHEKVGVEGRQVKELDRYFFDLLIKEENAIATVKIGNVQDNLMLLEEIRDEQNQLCDICDSFSEVEMISDISYIEGEKEEQRYIRAWDTGRETIVFRKDELTGEWERQ